MTGSAADKPERQPTRSRLSFAAGIVLAACLATVFTFQVFGLATSPRSAEALLFPTATPTIVTPAPPTSTPIAGIPALDTLLYHEDFAQRGSWPTDPRFHYGTLWYTLSPDTQSDFVAVSAPGFDGMDYRALGIQTEASRPNGSSGEWGVFLWHDIDTAGRERFIAFTVTPRGTWRLRTYAPFTSTAAEKVFRWTDLVPETANPAIFSGKPNRVRVEIRPGQVKAFINDSKVLDRSSADIDTYRNRPDFDGEVGILVIPASSARSDVEFHGFSIYSPNEGQ